MAEFPFAKEQVLYKDSEDRLKKLHSAIEKIQTERAKVLSQMEQYEALLREVGPEDHDELNKYIEAIRKYIGMLEDDIAELAPFVRDEWDSIEKTMVDMTNNPNKPKA